MGQVTKLRLSCYLVLLSIDSKTRYTRQPQFRDLTHIILIQIDYSEMIRANILGHA